MDSFKIFVESDIASLLANMLQNRGHFDRTVAGDQLADRGDSLGAFLHMSKEAGTAGDDYDYGKYNELRNQLHNEFASQGYYINFGHGTVVDPDGITYRIQGGQVARLRSGDSHNPASATWAPVRGVAGLPEPVVRGLIALLGWRMSQHNDEASETVGNFRRARQEFYTIMFNMCRRIRYIGDTVPAAWVKRLQSAAQHAIDTKQGVPANEISVMRDNVSHLINHLAMYRTMPQLEVWLGKLRSEFPGS
jgi:hypothetical protein